MFLSTEFQASSKKILELVNLLKDIIIQFPSYSQTISACSFSVLTMLFFSVLY